MQEQKNKHRNDVVRLLAEPTRLMDMRLDNWRYCDSIANLYGNQTSPSLASMLQGEIRIIPEPRDFENNPPRPYLWMGDDEPTPE